MLALFCRRRRGDKRRCCRGWAQRGGGGEKKRRRSGWRNSSMDDVFHLFRSRGEDEITYFREWNRPSSSTKTQAIVGTLWRLLSSCPAGVPGQKNPRRKTHEFEWVPNGQDSPPRGCNFLLVLVLTLYIPRGDHPLGLIWASWVWRRVYQGLMGIGLRVWKDGYHNFLCIWSEDTGPPLCT